MMKKVIFHINVMELKLNGKKERMLQKQSRRRSKETRKPIKLELLNLK